MVFHFAILKFIVIFPSGGNMFEKLKLEELDRMALELSKMNKRLAQAAAEKALAQNETADLHYKYTVLQIYMKYGLTPSDSIDENGNIIKNADQAQQEDTNENK